MRSIRSWFTSEARASESLAQDYTGLLLAQSLAAARGDGGNIRSQAAYRGALTLIGHSTGVATLEGQHSAALQPHLSTISRAMIDVGQSDWLIQVDSDGELMLLPVTVATVVGGPDPRTWLYSLTMSGPSEAVTLQRPGESILSFRLRVDQKIPWRGRPAIDSIGTGALLVQLEAQMCDEAKVTPARVIAGGAVAEQAGDISELIGAGGVVGITQAIASREDPSGIKAGVIRNEVTAPSVSLHTKLATMICGAMGVPADLVLGSSSESGSRESMRRLGSTTIQNILVTVAREWELKMGTALEWNLNNLRSSDEVSRARAAGSRATAVQRLVQSGVDLPQALAIAGID